LTDVLRQSIYSRMAGYEDVNDAGRLSQDPLVRMMGSEKIWDRGAALRQHNCGFKAKGYGRRVSY
jgi:hypothetical protein